jgi:hypothetical protein
MIAYSAQFGSIWFPESEDNTPASLLWQSRLHVVGHRIEAHRGVNHSTMKQFPIDHCDELWDSWTSKCVCMVLGA